MPAYIKHAGDTNTYFGFPGNDTYVIGTNNVERFRIESGGDVGIGTNNPGRRLDIRGSSGELFGYTDGTRTVYGGCDSNSPWFGTATNDDLRLVTNGSEKMVIKSSGYVGIGTNGPTTKFQVYDSTTHDVRIRNTCKTSVVGTYSGSSLELTDQSFHGGYVEGVHLANVTHGLYLGGYSNGTRDTPAICIRGGTGRVGIGTTEPGCSLAVYRVNNGDVTGSQVRSFFYAGIGNIIADSASGSGDICIYSQGWVHSTDGFIASNGTLVASDIRIKKNIVDADDAECLETLRLLKPKKYQYRDTVVKSEEPVWGFIAQEVRETLPYATDLRRDVLPNIYELANVSQSNVITFVNFNTSNLESNATTLIRTKGIDDKDHNLHLVEVIDEHTIRVEEDLTEWTGSVDETGNVITEITTTTLTPEEYEALKDKAGCVANISGYQNANVVISIEEYNGLEDTTGYEEVIENYTKTTTIYPGTQLFVYGQEVDDFIYVKKEAIWTVATAALQEVDRQQQADKLQIAELETQLASVLARLDALESA
jgi:hypothetical protein